MTGIEQSLRPGWHRYFTEIAKAVALRGECIRSKVGAVLVDQDHRIVSTGYNGVAPGEPSCLDGECVRCARSYEEEPSGKDYSDCIETHAELNALLYAGRDKAVGSTLYITREPCYQCQKLIQAAGVIRVIYLNEDGRMVQWYTEFKM